MGTLNVLRIWIPNTSAIVVGLAVLGTLLLIALWRDPGPDLAPADSASLALGQALYMAHCASCHGAELEGQPDWQSPNPDGTLPAPPHDETGHTWHHGDGLLTDYVRLGGRAVLDDLGVSMPSAMPGFGDVLQDSEITSILDYIKAHWPANLRAYQQAATRLEAESAANGDPGAESPAALR